MKKFQDIIDNMPSVQSIEVNHDLVGHYIKVEVDESIVSKKERNALDEAARKDNRIRIIYFKEH